MSNITELNQKTQSPDEAHTHCLLLIQQQKEKNKKLKESISLFGLIPIVLLLFIIGLICGEFLQ